MSRDTVVADVEEAQIVFGVLHGGGNGILTIAKGTLPLVLFGPAGYGERQGLLMVPARIAQALSPWLFGLCLDRFDAGAMWVSALLGLAALGALLLLRPVAAAVGRPRQITVVARDPAFFFGGKINRDQISQTDLLRQTLPLRRGSARRHDLRAQPDRPAAAHG